MALVIRLERVVYIYTYFNIALGSRNFIYDIELHRFRLGHKPTFIYSALLSSLYISTLPYAIKEIVTNSHNCILPTFLLYINWILALVNTFVFFNTLVTLWWHRLCLYRTENKGMCLLAAFIKKTYASKELQLLLHSGCFKLLVVTIIRIWGYVRSVQWVTQSSNSGCDETNEQESDLSVYIGLIAAAMLARETLVHYNLYIGILQGNMLLTGCRLEMTELAEEVRQLSAAEKLMSRIPSWHKIHWTQLHKHCERVIRNQQDIRDFVGDFVSYQQCHLLATLLKYLLEGISMAFGVALESQIDRNHALMLMFSLFVAFLNLVLLFGECEGIKLNAEMTKQIIFELRQELSLHVDSVCECRRDLSVMLEMVSLDMQRRQNELQLWGFCNLNMHTALSLIKAVLLNGLLLVQYTFLAMHRELDEKQLSTD